MDAANFPCQPRLRKALAHAQLRPSLAQPVELGASIPQFRQRVRRPLFGRASEKFVAETVLVLDTEQK